MSSEDNDVQMDDVTRVTIGAIITGMRLQNPRGGAGFESGVMYSAAKAVEDVLRADEEDATEPFEQACQFLRAQKERGDGEESFCFCNLLSDFMLDPERYKEGEFSDAMATLRSLASNSRETGDEPGILVGGDRYVMAHGPAWRFKEVYAQLPTSVRRVLYNGVHGFKNKACWCATVEHQCHCVDDKELTKLEAFDKQVREMLKADAPKTASFTVVMNVRDFKQHEYPVELLTKDTLQLLNPRHSFKLCSDVEQYARRVLDAAPKLVERAKKRAREEE